MKKDIKAQVALLRSVRVAIECACDASGDDRAFAALVETITRQEKEHRAFGRRLVGASAIRGRSLAVAVDYFVCKVVHEGLTTYQYGAAPISELRGVRADYVQGALLASGATFRDKLTAQLLQRFPGETDADDAYIGPLARAASVDYCDLVGGND